MSTKQVINTIEDKHGKFLDFKKVFCYEPPVDGFFHLIKGDYPQPSKYYSCRESFARRYKSQKSFGFHLPNFERIEPVKVMVKWAEKKLGIKPSRGAKFQIAKMKSGYMLIVQPGNWWKTNELRRQVLTCLMREAINTYNNELGDSPEDKIQNSDQYFYNDHLKNNFNKFLSGYTHTDKRLTFNRGWVVNFCTKSSGKHLFVKKPDKKVKNVKKNS